jgi:hypothetical protein
LPSPTWRVDLDNAVWCRYEGEFIAGVRCGRGTMHYANGDTYVGAWEDGETHGFGVFKWAKGEKAGATHEGHFLPGGMRVGVGKFTKENQDVYECEWVDDLPHGFGKITYPGLPCMARGGLRMAPLVGTRVGRGMRGS